MASDNLSIFDDLVIPPGGAASAGLIALGARPLPMMLAPNEEKFPRKVANCGLWWERYGATMVEKVIQKRNGQSHHVPNSFKISAREWVEDLINHSHVTLDDAQRIAAYADRLKHIAIAGAPGGLAIDMTLTSRLITGMGLPHPIENSLVFHPTLGCPYIPGSTIKGAVQAFADEWLSGGGYDDVPEDLRRVMTRIFGQASRTSGDQTTAVGSVIFFDAVPLTPPVLTPEVMTPHVGNYLIGESDLPLETTSPKPIYFLAIDPGEGGASKFRFCLRPSVRAQTEVDGCSDVELAAGWLVACLRDVGIGAKTKSGFGRFDLPQIHRPGGSV